MRSVRVTWGNRKDIEMRVQRASLARADFSQLSAGDPPNLILYFGSRPVITSEAPFMQLKKAFSGATIVGCSTGGQIRDDEVVDDDIEVVAIWFDATTTRLAKQVVTSAADSRQCGRLLGEDLHSSDLSGIFILADGLNVNGSDLIAGITSVVGSKVALSGGLAGDGSDFSETLVGADCPPKSNLVAAIGFYGDAIQFGHGSAGGWDVFGPWRSVTRSRNNVLFQLDGEPALGLYERYLGEEAAGLPGTALRFPLQIRDPNNPDHMVIRTILAIDRDMQSLTFAGDVPQGWQARLMRGVFDRLVVGAEDAARQARRNTTENTEHECLALLVSCIGRRILMGQRTSNEIEAASAELGCRFKTFGFYSYGEISPHPVSNICELHNQTMTVTTITEVLVV
jgi:hypothetical protein